MSSNFIVDGRKEFFGSVFYHTTKRLYYGFDTASTKLLLSLQKISSLAEFLKQNKTSQNEIKNFISFLQKNEFLDHDFRFNGELRNNKPPTEYLSAPLRVHLAITSLCPLNCKHCKNKLKLNSTNFLNQFYTKPSKENYEKGNV